MSESTQTSETTPQEQQQPQPVKKKQYQQGGNRDERHNYHQQRPHYRRPNRAPYVEDLREKLNRIRREKDEGQGSSSAPPPDPNYNFLKDPARDGESSAAAPEKPHQHNNQYNQNRRTNEPRNRYHSNRPQKPVSIQPVNIKVELSTSTGRRSCVMDEEHKLPEIKHVPDRHESDRRTFGTRYYSGFRNTSQQQQQHYRKPPPPQRRPYQQNRRDFKREQRSDNNQEAVVSKEEEENWDAEIENAKSVNTQKSIALGANSENLDQEQNLNVRQGNVEHVQEESGDVQQEVAIEKEGVQQDVAGEKESVQQEIAEEKEGAHLQKKNRSVEQDAAEQKGDTVSSEEEHWPNEKKFEDVENTENEQLSPEDKPSTLGISEDKQITQNDEPELKETIIIEPSKK